VCTCATAKVFGTGLSQKLYRKLTPKEVGLLVWYLNLPNGVAANEVMSPKLAISLVRFFAKSAISYLFVEWLKNKHGFIVRIERVDSFACMLLSVLLYWCP